MTVTKWQKIWPYILLAFLLVVVYPLVNAIFSERVSAILNFQKDMNIDFSIAKVFWGATLAYFTWSLIIFVILPYSSLYIFTALKNNNIFKKLFLFYTFLSINGLLVPSASPIDIFKTHFSPEIWIVYFLLTISLCPLCNIALNKLVKNRELVNSS